MSDDILATIDGALADYAMSGDAMRWTPDPPAAGRPQIDLTPEQIEALRRAGFHATAAATRAVTSLNRAFRQFARAVNGAVAKVDQAFAEMEPATRKAICDHHGIQDHWAARERAAQRKADPRAYALTAKAARGTGPPKPIPSRRPPRRIGAA